MGLGTCYRAGVGVGMRIDTGVYMAMGMVWVRSWAWARICGYRYTHRYTGIQVNRYTGKQVNMYTGIEMHRSTGVHIGIGVSVPV